MIARTDAVVDVVELAYLFVVVAIMIAGWTALGLAEIGAFAGVLGSAISVAVGGVGGALVVTIISRRARARFMPMHAALALAPLVLAAFLLRAPHEWIVGGLDPGVYTNTAAQIAQTGGIVWHDPNAADLADGGRGTLFREPRSPFAEGSRFIGYYFQDVAERRIVPHGMHLFPAIMAIGHGLGGMHIALAVPPILALLGIAGTGVAAARIAGPVAGVLAALFLALNPAETWFGRYPAAELVVQATLLGAVLLLARALELRSTTLAALAGWLLGLIHLAKIDTFVLPLAVGVVVGWLVLAGHFQRVHGWFLVGYAIALAHTALHVATISTHYAFSVYAQAIPPALRQPAALVAGTSIILAGGLAALWLAHRHGRALSSLVERRSAVLWTGLATVVVVALAYAWYVRPADLAGDIARAPESLQVVVRNRLHSLPRLGWYVPPLAILLGAAGALGVARHLFVGWPASEGMRRTAPAFGLLLAIISLEAIVVLADPRINPEYPWAARRWIGILIPGIVLFAAVQLAWLAPTVPRGTRSIQRALVPMGLALSIVATSAAASAPLLSHREFVGSSMTIRAIASAAPENAIILFDHDLVGFRFSLPMEFVGERAAYVLFGEAGRDERMREPIDSWAASGRPIYWLRHGEPSQFERWGRHWQPVGYWQTDLPEVVPTLEEPPTATKRFVVPLTLYRAE